MRKILIGDHRRKGNGKKLRRQLKTGGVMFVHSRESKYKEGGCSYREHLRRHGGIIPGTSPRGKKACEWRERQICKRQRFRLLGENARARELTFHTYLKRATKTPVETEAAAGGEKEKREEQRQSASATVYLFVKKESRGTVFGSIRRVENFSGDWANFPSMDAGGGHIGW